MRQLKLNRVTSRKIDVIGKLSAVKVDKNDDLLSVLTTLFPEKRGYLKKSSGKSLRVTFQSDFPFGPDPDVLSSFLFDNLEDDLQMLKKKYPISDISLVGIGNEKNDSRKELNLSAWELKKLIDVTKHDSYTAQIPFSIFIDSDSVYSFSLSPDLTYKDLFDLAEPLKNRNLDDFKDAVDGGSLKGESLVSSTPVRHICPKEWGYKSASGFLFSYPDFNRTISMADNCDRTVEPCINCLACSSACPAGIYPALLYHHLKEENLTEANAMGLQLCMFCRRCSVVCPSNIPLSELIIKTVAFDSGDET